MTTQRAINGSPIVFTPSGTYASKLHLRLEEMRPFELPGILPMPDTVEIIGAYLALQIGDHFPATAVGNMWVSQVSPWYTRLGGTPVEVYHPFGLTPLVQIHMARGYPHIAKGEHSTPIIYRRGIDQILIATELYGASGFPVMVYPTFIVRGETTEWPFEAGVVWSMPMDAETSGTWCLRSRIPAIGVGGTTVHVRVKAGPSGCNLGSVGVGIQASGPNMVAAPIPVLFGGAAPLNLGANAEAWGVANLTTAPGDNLLINVETAGVYRYRTAIPGADPVGASSPPEAPSWYGTTDSSASAAMLGAPTHILRPYVVDCVKVL